MRKVALWSWLLLAGLVFWGDASAQTYPKCSYFGGTTYTDCYRPKILYTVSNAGTPSPYFSTKQAAAEYAVNWSRQNGCEVPHCNLGVAVRPWAPPAGADCHDRHWWNGDNCDGTNGTAYNYPLDRPADRAFMVMIYGYGIAYYHQTPHYYIGHHSQTVKPVAFCNPGDSQFTDYWPTPGNSYSSYPFKMCRRATTNTFGLKQARSDTPSGEDRNKDCNNSGCNPVSLATGIKYDWVSDYRMPCTAPSRSRML